MSAPDESVPPQSGTTDAAGVLAKLPRTRPQRASARRASARAHKPAAKRAPAQPATAVPAQPVSGAPTQPATAAPAARKRSPRGARAAAAPTPRQGFESEAERSRTVHPPGGAELVASAAEIVGELAKAGVSAGERLLKDAFSRLPF